MNKIQIKAEILSTISLMLRASTPDLNLLDDLRKIEDAQAVFDILIKELSSANEHRSLVICWILTELYEREDLNNRLWDVIKSPEYNDKIKMSVFNMLKGLGSDIDYDLISEYFEQFDKIINDETKEILDVAIMNPETQIDFMDFMNALKDEDKITLIKSLEDDYSYDALANILIPVFIYYKGTELGDLVLDILGRTKSQLALHALLSAYEYMGEKYKTKINKAISELKLSGIRVDNTLDFYKKILSESKPYKSFVSFPDGHGNVAMIYARKRNNGSLQFFATVVNPEYGILDAFGFNELSEYDFERIVNKFYNGQEHYEIPFGEFKYILMRAKELSYGNEDVIPYEYVCWESSILDIEECEIKLDIEKQELNQKEVDELCLNDFVQNWFFDEYTSVEFKDFINNLSKEFLNNNFKVDLDKYIADNYDKIYTPERLDIERKIFMLSAYLRKIKGDDKYAKIFYSLDTNYSFLTNIIRKSIYEHYVGKRYILNNKRKTANVFESRFVNNEGEFELLQLDMIISGIENKWVDNE